VNDPPRRRPPGFARRPGPWLLASLVLAAAALPGGLAAAHVLRVAPEVGWAHPLASSANFSVNFTDAPSYTPRYLSAVVNGTVSVSVHLHNNGSLAHTFTVVNSNQSGVVLNRSWTPSQLDAYFAANGTLAAVNLTAGQSGWANLSLASSATFRSFEFVSTIPYQFQAGMWGFLNLTPTGPTLLLTDNTTNTPAFVPNVLATGTTVHGVVNLHVHLINQGDVTHTFTVSSQVNTSFTSLAEFDTYGQLANVIVPGSAPLSAWANFTVTTPGFYEYVCTESGHFAAGMFGFLYVEVSPPSPPSPPSTALVEVPVLVGSAVLLGIGLVLALGSAYAGRFPRRRAPPGEHP
jgi:uncharacterized cupredoxin-like copper-binding protein